MIARRSTPDLPFLALCFCLLLTVLTGRAWLSDQAEKVRESWIGEERDGLRRILQNTLRLGSPQTCFAEIMRRTIRDLRAGRTLPDSFRRFRPWAGTQLELLVFDADGRRLTMEGFRLERGAVSEKVLHALLEPAPTSTTNIRKLSASFLGMRTGLEKLAESPASMVELPGSTRYAYAGWWSVRDVGAPETGAAASTKVRVLKYDVLLLVPKKGLETPVFLRRSVLNMRRLLHRHARLDLVRHADRSESAVAFSLSRRVARLDVRLACTNAMDLRIRRRVQTPATIARMLNALEAAHLALVLGSLLVLAVGFRQFRPDEPERLTLGRLIRLGLLGSVIPALTMFLTWTFVFLHTSSKTMSWQAHRKLEHELERIDRDSSLERRRVDVRLNRMIDGVQGLSDSEAAKKIGVELEGCPQVEAAFLIEPYGKVLATPRRHRSTHETQRVFALSVAVNLTAVLENREPKSICRESFDLTFVKGFTRYLLENFGRTEELTGFGMRRSVFVRLVRGETSTTPRYFVALLNLDDLQKQYVRNMLAQHSRECWLGMVETGPAGPNRGYPERLLWNPDLLSLVEEAHRLRRTTDVRLQLPRRGTYLASAIPGRQLSGHVLVGMVPYQPIDQRIRLWLGTAVFALVGIIILGVGAALALAGYLRTGMHRLEDGLYNLQHRHFELSPVSVDDQLSCIYQGMVTAGRTLDELYAAAPVQKTLVHEGTTRKAGLLISSYFQAGPFLGGDFADVLE
ncbi:MAG TPA: hypothetical protein PKO06_13520, partial [Candidatus Ozemobacteraceae bacterium]|nr:hypothetical protein [Candidatus Ozemobacteraceae bacterium]